MGMIPTADKRQFSQDLNADEIKWFHDLYVKKIKRIKYLLNFINRQSISEIILEPTLYVTGFLRALYSSG